MHEEPIEIDVEETKADSGKPDDYGVIAVANAPYNIHCLTVIGQIVSIDNVIFNG